MKTLRNVRKEIKFISDEEKAEIDKSVAEEIAEIKKTMMKKNNFDELVTVSQTISLIKDVSRGVTSTDLAPRLLRHNLEKLVEINERYSHCLDLYLANLEALRDPGNRPGIRQHIRNVIIVEMREIFNDNLEIRAKNTIIDDKVIIEALKNIDDLVHDKNNKEKYDKRYHTNLEDLAMNVLVIIQVQNFGSLTYRYLFTCLDDIISYLEGSYGQ